MSLYAGTTTYVYQTCGKEFDSLGAAEAELSRVLGYTVTDAHTYDVTTMEDGAKGFEVYLVWVDPPATTPDDTQEVDVVLPARN